VKGFSSHPSISHCKPCPDYRFCAAGVNTPAGAQGENLRPELERNSNKARTAAIHLLQMIQ